MKKMLFFSSMMLGLFLLFGTVGVAQTFTSSPATAITDNACPTMDTHTQDLTASGVGVLGTTNELLSVEIDITHTWDSDLTVQLVAPGGVTSIVLTDGNGGSGDDYTSTVFTDGAATSITAGSAPFTGSFIPEGAISTFNDGILNANGVWTLEVCDGANGDTGTINSWNMIFQPVPTCPNPSGGTAAAVTGTTADLAWTAGGAEVDWNIEIGGVGFAVDTGAEDFALTANPAPEFIGVPGLTLGNDYEFYVQANCGAGGLSGWVGPFSWNQTPAPANDLCGGAITAVSGMSYTGDTSAATETDEETGFCGTGQGGPGVWYVYAGNDADVTVDLSLSAFDTKIQVWSGSCGSLTCEGGNDDGGTGTTSLLTFPANTGTNYYIYVFGFGTATGAYDLAVSSTPFPPAPANDDCATATDVSGGATIVGETTLGASDNGDASGCGMGLGVWYEYTGDDTDVTVDITNSYDVEISVSSSADCLTFLNISCTDGAVGDETTTFTAALGTTYYIYIAGWSDTGTTTGNFDITVTSVACTGPTATFTAVAACGTSEYTVDIDVTDMGDATSYDVQDGGISVGTVSGTGIVNVGPFASGVTADLVLVHNSDVACNMANPVGFACPPANDDCSTATDITGGITLLGETTHGSSDNGDDTGCGMSEGVWYEYTGDDTDVTVDVTTAAYDIEVSLSTSADCVTFSNISCTDGALAAGTETVSFTAVSGTTYYIYVASYFGFSTGPTGDFDIAVTSVSCSGPTATFTAVPDCGLSQYTIDIDVTDMGDAGSYDILDGAVSIGTVAGTGIVNVGPFASGVTADLTLVHNTNTACNLTNTFDFSCPPANDLCAGALTATCGNTYTGNTDSATADDVPATCGTTATAPGVWYTMAGTNDNVTLDLSLSTYDTKIHVYSGSCGALVCVDGDDDGGTGVTSLVTFGALTGTNYYIYVSGFSANTGDFDMAVSCVALSPCATPTGLGASNINHVQADLDWTENGTASTWDIEFGAAGFTPAGTATVGYAAVSPNPYTLTGLTASTAYEYYVSGAGCNDWAGPFAFTTTAPPPSNDDCANAIALACGSLTAGSTSTATFDDPVTACGAGYAAANIWYTYTGTGTEELIQLSTCNDGDPLTGDATYDTRITVFSGGCGSFVCVADNDDGAGCTGFSSSTSFVSDGTTTYHIMVHGYSQGFTPPSGDFNLSLECGPNCVQANTNQDCLSAASQLVDGSTTTYDNTCASVALSNPTCDSFGTVADLWVSFTAPASGAVDIAATYGTATNLNFALYSGTCGSLVQEFCNTGIIGVSYTALTPTNTYYLQMWNAGGAQEGTFDISMTELTAPANDDLCNAEALTVDAAPSAGTNILATVETNEPAGANWGESGVDNTVWYSFVAPVDGQCVVTTDFAGGSNGDTQITVFDATGVTCADMTTLPTETDSDDDSGTAENFNSVLTFTTDGGNALTPGTTYYVQVDGYFGSLGTFDIQVSTCLPVTNLAVVSATVASMVVSWDSNLGDSYEVRRTVISDGEVFNPSQPGTPVSGNAGSTSKTIYGLTSDGTYEIRVRNMCNGEWSAPLTRNGVYNLPYTHLPSPGGAGCNSVTLDFSTAQFIDLQFTASAEQMYFVGQNVTDAAFDMVANVASVDFGTFIGGVDATFGQENEAGLISGFTVGEQYVLQVSDFFGTAGGTVDVCMMPIRTPKCCLSPGYPTIDDLGDSDYVCAGGADDYSTTWTSITNPLDIYTAGPQPTGWFVVGDIGVPNASETYDVINSATWTVPAGGDVGAAVATTVISVDQTIPCQRTIVGEVNDTRMADYYSFGTTDCTTADVSGHTFPINVVPNTSEGTDLDHWVWEITDLDTPGNPSFEYETATNFAYLTNDFSQGIRVVNVAYIAGGGGGDLMIRGNCYSVRVKGNPVGAIDASLPYGPARTLKINGVSGASIGSNPNEGGGLSDFITRTEETIEAEVAIYPNPNQGDFFNLNVTGVVEDVVTLDIYDMFGKLVQSEQITVAGDSVNEIVKLNDLASGIYTVKINVAGNITNERLVIEK